MKLLKKILGGSWKTSLLGIVLLLLGAWSFLVHWVPNQTIYFNIIYAEIPSIAVLAVGWLGIHARDHSHKDDVK